MFVSLTRGLFATVVGAVALLHGCGYQHSSDAFFPANWASAYEIIADCASTKHPRGGHMEVWIDPVAVEAFAAGEPLPAGSVLVKPQWDEDANCGDDPDLFTVMRAGDESKWEWQTIGGRGKVKETEPDSCSGCHAACDESLLCTQP
ncbi:MAG: cytochrome P460 family protein [Nannocystaceae bacterium]